VSLLHQNLLLEMEGGLGEVGGTAEVAPIVVIGAEGEDFFALSGDRRGGGPALQDGLRMESRRQLD